MLKKILLVGGTGYLGRHLYKQLIAEDLQVFITGTGNSTQGNYFQVNFEEPESYRSLNDHHFDVVMVLAAKLNSLTSTELNHPDLSVNTLGYASFLQYMMDQQLTGKVIYISSMTVYSPSNQAPVSEGGAIAPVNTYGLSKYIAECMTSFFCINSNIPGAILRLPGIYGGDKKGGFIYNTVNNLKKSKPIQLSTKNLIFWETIHIDDLCFMICNFIKKYKWEQKIDIYNICYGQETDFYDTFEFIKGQTADYGALISETERGYVQFFLSNEKLKKLIPVREDYYGKLKEYITDLP
jgi:nucleoside-diphosphate-sugar epimerase